MASSMVTIWSVVILGHIDPVGQALVLANVHTVNLHQQLLVHIGVRGNVRCDKLDWVVEDNVLCVVGGDWHTLHLGNQHIQLGLGKVLALVDIQVNEIGPGAEHECIGCDWLGRHIGGEETNILRDNCGECLAWKVESHSCGDVVRVIGDCRHVHQTTDCGQVGHHHTGHNLRAVG